MFSRPNSKDPSAIVADYIELQCFLSGASVSVYSLRSLFSMPDDELDNSGVESSDDLSIDSIEDGIKECGQRSASCPMKYPFEVESILQKHPTLFALSPSTAGRRSISIPRQTSMSSTHAPSLPLPKKNAATPYVRPLQLTLTPLWP